MSFTEALSIGCKRPVALAEVSKSSVLIRRLQHGKAPYEVVQSDVRSLGFRCMALTKWCPGCRAALQDCKQDNRTPSCAYVEGPLIRALLSDLDLEIVSVNSIEGRVSRVTRI